MKKWFSSQIGSSLVGAVGFRVGVRVLAAIAQAVTLALLARYVGPPTFGLFGQVVSIGYLISPILGFGLSSRMLRLGGEPDPERLVSSAYLLRFLSTTVLSVVLILTFGVVNGSFTSAAFAASCLIFGDFLSDINQAVLSGQRRQATAGVALVVQRISPLVAVVISPTIGLDPFVAAGLGFLLSAVVPIGLAIRSWTRPTPLLSTIISSRHYWVAGLTSSIGQLDTTIARATTGLGPTGVYASGARLGNPLSIVTSSLLFVFVPEMASARGALGRIQIFRRVRLYSLLYAVLLAVASPVAAAAFIWILGKSYESGRLLLISFVVATAISGISQSYEGYLVATDRPRVISLSIGVGTAMGLIALGLGGYAWGVVGLALGPVTGQVTILALFTFFTRISIREDLGSQEG